MSIPEFRPPAPRLPDAAALRPRADDTLERAARVAVLDLVARLVPHLEEAWQAEHPEGVHQLRVVARRLRSAMQTLGALWPDEAPHWIRGLAELADAAGRARDLDVLVADLSGRLDDVSGARRQALEWMLEQAREERAACQPGLRRDLEDFAASGLLERMVDSLAAPLRADADPAPAPGRDP